MTYFSLRKHGRTPNLDEPETPDAEDESADETPPAGPVGALRAGLCGPGAWMTAHFGPSTSWLVHVGSVWAVGYYGAWPAAGVIGGWLCAFLLFVPSEALDRFSALLERCSGHQPVKPPATPAGTPVDSVVPVLWRLIADAPGTHLKTLTAHLQNAAPEQPLDKAAVRAHLVALKIPVRPSVRDTVGKVNEGVHRADLKAWQEALPGAAPDAAPEARSSPVATAVTCDVAEAATPVATPLSRLRGRLSRGAA